MLAENSGVDAKAVVGKHANTNNNINKKETILLKCCISPDTKYSTEKIKTYVQYNSFVILCTYHLNIYTLHAVYAVIVYEYPFYGSGPNGLHSSGASCFCDGCSPEQ